jgi:hypothetical protein
MREAKGTDGAKEEAKGVLSLPTSEEEREAGLSEISCVERVDDVGSSFLRTIKR